MSHAIDQMKTQPVQALLKRSANEGIFYPSDIDTKSSLISQAGFQLGWHSQALGI